MNQPDRDSNGRGYGAGNQPSSGLDHCIRPGLPMPETVLLAVMTDGGLLLQGWRSGPCAYMCAADAAPLLRTLEAAFGVDIPTTDHNQTHCPRS